MTFPAGVITRQVIVGPFLGEGGEVIRGQVQVQLPISLKWLADGTIILPTPETILLDSSTGQGELTLPIIQDGFVTGPNNDPVADFYYDFTPILNSASPVPVNVLQVHLGYGDGTPFTPNFTTPISGNGVVIYLPGGPGPKGDPGAPGPATPLPTPAADATTLAPGSAATVSVDPGFQFHFGVPQGQPGVNGNGQGVPTGGTSGQVLTKNSSTNYDTSWANNGAQGVPAGGTASQILAKVDGTNYNTQWVNVPIALPNGGTTGQVLTKNSGTDGDASWAAIPAQHDLPIGGTTGQYLKKNTNTDRDVGWATLPANGLPTGGTAGQFLKKNSLTDGDASFASLSYADALPGSLFVLARSGGAWPSVRPSNRTDIRFAWAGQYTGDANEPPIVTSGTGGMLDGVDLRWRY